MPTPQIFKSRSPVLEEAAAAAAAAQAETPLGGAAGSRRLNFDMERQQQENWCWAAVSTSASHFFDAASAWHQCLLANREFGQNTCCQNGGSTACDQENRLERGLRLVGRDRGHAPGALSFDRVRAEIDAGRPVGCWIRWGSDGKGHFVVIEGYQDQGGRRKLFIEDPWYGTSDPTFDDFRLRYQNARGAWQWTYFIG